MGSYQHFSKLIVLKCSGLKDISTENVDFYAIAKNE